MQDRIAPERAAKAGPASRDAHAVRFAMLVLCALVGGCSSFTIEAPLLVTDPGKFQYHNCDQLNASGHGARTAPRR